MKKRVAKKILCDCHGRDDSQLKRAAAVLRKTCETHEISLTYGWVADYLGGMPVAFNNLWLVVGLVDKATFQCIILRKGKS